MNGNGLIWQRTDIEKVGLSGSIAIPTDLDYDGDIDILGRVGGHDARIAWWENTNGSCNPLVEHTIAWGYSDVNSIVATDIDSDGDRDILLGSRSYNSGQIAWLENFSGSVVLVNNEVRYMDDANWESPYYSQSDQHPVVCVSWNDAKAYTTWLDSLDPKYSYRLPTEAEWEYVCRAGIAGTRFSWDDESDEGVVNNYAWYFENSRDKAHLVRSKLANAWDVYDMHGNVFEWCQDWYSDEYYQEGQNTNPHGPASGSNRIMRGGCWSSGVETLRSAARFQNSPNGRSNFIGFRVVRTILSKTSTNREGANDESNSQLFHIPIHHNDGVRILLKKSKFG